VYLTMREAVRNAVKHSGCARIGVTLEVRGGDVYGFVGDDGEGFDPEAVGRATPSRGVGNLTHTLCELGSQRSFGYGCRQRQAGNPSWRLRYSIGRVLAAGLGSCMRKCSHYLSHPCLS
jgi:hypothetical protein